MVKVLIGFFTNVTFTNCTSNADGGAVYASSTANNWTFIFVNFTDCISSNGGAVFINGGIFAFGLCDFINNKATIGAAMYIGSGGGPVNYCRFLNNVGNYQIYYDGSSYVRADYNWWGTNSPSSLYNLNVIVDYYFEMKISIWTDNNTLSVGDHLTIRYFFVLNGTNDNYKAEIVFSPFYVSIYNNGVFLKNIDGRVSGFHNIPLTALSNSIVFQLDDESSIIIFSAKRGNVNIDFASSSVYYGQDVLLKGVLKDQAGNLLANRFIILNINGFIVNLKSDSKGEFSYNYLANKFIGSKSIVANFLGDELYHGGSKVSVFTVNKIVSSLVVSNFKALFKKNNLIKVTILDKNGKGITNKQVKFYVNNNLIATAKTDSIGVASFYYTFKTRKTHTIVAKFEGDTFYLAKNSATFKAIPKDMTSITLAKVSPKFNKKVTFRATLKNHKKKLMVKKIVIFLVNGKSIGKAKTNAKGVATLTKIVKVKGSVKFMTRFAGDKNSHDSNQTRKVTVK